MKKKIAAVSVVLLTLAILCSGTLAYFTRSEQAHNVITTSGIGIELVEKTRDENGAMLDFPKEGISGVMPGTSVSKIVSVSNSGGETAWIRIRVEQRIVDAAGAPLPLTLPSGDAVMTLTMDSENWLDGGDGYFYFKRSVPAGASTTTLFEEVFFSAKMGNEYQNCTANIIVTAHAVQTANNPIPDGGDVTDIKGWPTEVNKG